MNSDCVLVVCKFWFPVLVVLRPLALKESWVAFTLCSVMKTIFDNLQLLLTTSFILDVFVDEIDILFFWDMSLNFANI
jgi:hypothetical protein